MFPFRGKLWNLEFDKQLLAKIEALRGVESVTLADFSPLSYTIRSTGVQVEGYVLRPHESMEIDWGQGGPELLSDPANFARRRA